MGAPETMRKRLLWFKEQNNKNFSISLGGVFIENVLRMDFSNPNYGKIETAVGYQRYYGGGSMRWNVPICSIFNYGAVEQIITNAYDEDLSLQLSATAVPSVLAKADTNRAVLQGMSALAANLRTKLHIFVGEFVSETVFDFSTNDSTVLSHTVPMLGLNGISSIKRIDTDYGAIDQIHVDLEIYQALTPPGSPTINMPWE